MPWLNEETENKNKQSVSKETSRTAITNEVYKSHMYQSLKAAIYEIVEAIVSEGETHMTHMGGIIPITKCDTCKGTAYTIREVFGNKY